MEVNNTLGIKLDLVINLKSDGISGTITVQKFEKSQLVGVVVSESFAVKGGLGIVKQNLGETVKEAVIKSFDLL